MKHSDLVESASTDSLQVSHQSTDQRSLEAKHSFKKKSQLKKHMIEEHGEGYECPCHPGKRFARRKYLTDHLARVRAKQAKKAQ